MINYNKLLNNATTPGIGKKMELTTSKPSIQLTGSTTSGTGSAVVNLLASHDGTGFGWVATITIALSTVLSTELLNDDIGKWGQLTAEIKSISGTDAVLNLIVGQ